MAVHMLRQHVRNYLSSW